MAGWTIKNELGIDATVLTTTESDLADCWGSVNTLGYDIAREGRRLYG